VLSCPFLHLGYRVLFAEQFGGDKPELKQAIPGILTKLGVAFIENSVGPVEFSD